jgi:hypothetical protein
MGMASARCTAHSYRHVPRFGQAGSLALVVATVLGVLGMHGLTSVENSAHGHEAAASHDAAGHASHRSPRGHGDSQPGSTWHDVVLCIWLLAGGVALVSLARSGGRALGSQRWALPRVTRLTHWTQRDPPLVVGVGALAVLRR